MAKMLNKQILKLDGKDTFFEIMANAFGIDKVQLNFRKYDDSKEKGSKITQSVDIFIDIPEALVLSQDILSGKIAQLAKSEKAKGAKYPGAVWQTMGGVNAEKAKERGLRTDGMALSRVLKIVPGLKQPFVFTAESGKGEENDKGLIVPRYGTTPENRIMVAVTDEQLKQIAMLIQTHVQAYYCAQYTTGAYMVEYTPKK